MNATLRFEELNEWRIHGIQFHSYKKQKKYRRDLDPIGISKRETKLKKKL